MVITLRLDEEYTKVFNELRQKLSDDTKSITITPSNSQILKAALLHTAAELHISVDKCKDV